MGREQAKINGVIVHCEGMNIDYWKKEIEERETAPDQFGKSNTVEFEDITEEDGSSYTSYWVF